MRQAALGQADRGQVHQGQTLRTAERAGPRRCQGGRRSRRRTLAAGVLASVVLAAGSIGVVSPVESARAAGTSQVGATFGRGVVDTYVSANRTKRHRGTSSTQRRTADPRPRLQYLLLPDCPGNTPATGAVGDCERSQTACPSGQQLFVAFEAPLGTPLRGAGWNQTPSNCLDPATSRVGEVVIPRLTGAELRRMPLPAGTSALQPDTGYALIGMPTNVYSTSPEPAVLHTTTMGLDVTIRLYPTAYEWDFGDGAIVGPTADPGGPYPNLTNAHTYRAAGPHTITMRTWYRGEFSVNGGAVQPIPGDGEVTSPPMSITVLTGEGRVSAGPNN